MPTNCSRTEEQAEVDRNLRDVKYFKAKTKLASQNLTPHFCKETRSNEQQKKILMTIHKTKL